MAGKLKRGHKQGKIRLDGRNLPWDGKVAGEVSERTEIFDSLCSSYHSFV